MFGLQALDLRLNGLERSGRSRLLQGKWEQHDVDQNRQHYDRYPVVRDNVVENSEEPSEHVLDGVKPGHQLVSSLLGTGSSPPSCRG